MTPLDLQVGISGSASSGNKVTQQVGAGDTSISTGGGKQTQTLFIVAGVVAVVIVAGLALMVALFRR